MSSAVKKRAFPAAVKQEIVQDWKHSTPKQTVRDVAAKYQVTSAGSIVKWSKNQNLANQ